MALGRLPVSMTTRVDSTRIVRPLFQEEDGGLIPTSTLHARDLRFGGCPDAFAVQQVQAWHSRLPRCQAGPWQFAFAAEAQGICYAVALWNTPSARCLPQHWIELRRMACAPDAPRYTASRFLAWMVRFLKVHHPDRETAMSYQDTAVHHGTIYKAAGWTATYTSKPRIRDRSGNRVGTVRKYRSNLNGIDTDASAKTRWEISLRKLGPEVSFPLAPGKSGASR